MQITRNLHPLILSDLEQYEQMIFVSGPRRAGKTTLAEMILSQKGLGRYWNNDIPEDQVLLAKKPFFFEEIDHGKEVKPLIVFDEIHKFPRWKNVLKGAYDRSRKDFSFLITGSGRLDLYQRGGDSLVGRYLLYHLFPLTINELTGKKAHLEDFLKSPNELPGEQPEAASIWKNLETLSGFPEPFIRGTETFYRRWSQAYSKQIVREDIRDLTHIRQLGQLEILSRLLPERVGNLFSTNSIREDLKVSFETIKSWIGVFESFFLVFLITPWSKKLTRAIQKEPKLYLYNWAAISDPGARFENMVALHLFQAVTLWNERGLGEFGLYFVRDRQKNEVDFLITSKKTPFLLVETKLGETEPAAALVKMKKLFSIPAVQLVNKPGISRQVTRDNEKILVVSADRWLSSLP
ncbi:MAG: ATPase, family [Deltaproteobacteria bacterium]|nr:ATPase, family [Deltaproteobacteria bacterium]